jgi:hypothetical protein
VDAARAIVAANRFMTLATADVDGVPWASPVWFAPDGERDFLWVSSPETRHSRNLVVRPELAIVIFDSHATPGTASALYVEAIAEQAETGIEAFSAHSVAQGLPVFTRADVSGAASLRLYRAHATARWLLGPGSRRIEAPFA